MHLHYRAGTLASLLYKAVKLSVCLSVCLHFCHADKSAVSASMETGLAQCEICAFDEY